MIYLIAAVLLGALFYAGWRVSQSVPARPQNVITGPEDDPEFLRHINRDNPSGH